MGVSEEVTVHVAARELGVTRPDGSCVVTTRSLNRDGYRESKYQGKYVGMAHRLVFMASGGVIRPGQTIDHLCGNRACLNVQHMEPVTLTENQRRANAPRLALIAGPPDVCQRASEERAERLPPPGHRLLPRVQPRLGRSYEEKRMTTLPPLNRPATAAIYSDLAQRAQDEARGLIGQALEKQAEAADYLNAARNMLNSAWSPPVELADASVMRVVGEGR